MDTTGAVTRPCPQCGARLRTGDSWCSLCYATIGGSKQPAPAPAPADAPAPAEPPHLPLQRRGPLLPGRPLVGGQVPPDLVDGLAAQLAAEFSPLPPAPDRRRYVLIASVGAAGVLVVLLVSMAVLGTLL